jgi:hypothetical protein
MRRARPCACGLRLRPRDATGLDLGSKSRASALAPNQGRVVEAAGWGRRRRGVVEAGGEGRRRQRGGRVGEETVAGGWDAERRRNPRGCAMRDPSPQNAEPDADIIGAATVPN